MRFGATLKSSTYEPWRDNYIDYSKLKKLLREDEQEGGKESWTEDDEAKFVEELLNHQLEKVNAFHDSKYKELRERTTTCESRFQSLPPRLNGESTENLDEKQTAEVQDIIQELDDITKQVNELEKYSRTNFSGFLKAAKKHDRKRGAHYKVRPLLQVRLASLPFNSEDYAPLLYELSTMYSVARQMEQGGNVDVPHTQTDTDGDKFNSHKFWVHPDNLLEVKTYILRRLPVLVYNPQTSKIADSGGSDPRMTSIYFDDAKFSLYTEKCKKISKASSLRLRWFGELADKPELVLEKKTVDETGDSEEIRVPIKEKHVQSFIEGQYKMEKVVDKLRDREGAEGGAVAHLQRSIDEIQAFIKDDELQPMLRANYLRTAFQIPGDDRVRISIDTDLAFIREDALDQDRPCRNPNEWHRTDIERLGLKYPFNEIRKGEVSRFPYALLEVKVNKGASKKSTKWVDELMASHLVKDAPRFSKFVHGVAELFEDYVNTFPFWLSELETDIRRDPEEAYREEQEKKAKQAADQQVVGSLLGSKGIVSFKSPSASPSARLDPIAKRKVPTQLKPEEDEASHEEEAGHDEADQHGGIFSGIRSLSKFSNSRYARAHRDGQVQLPPGVTKPEKWIKDANPVRVEPKVWLANQRTFVKWQHVSVLLTSLSLALYNGAGAGNNLARALGLIYTIIAVFAAGWGWWMYVERSRMIQARSGKDFDNILGPIIICLALNIALCLNFGFKYMAAVANNPNFRLDLKRVEDGPGWEEL